MAGLPRCHQLWHLPVALAGHPHFEEVRALAASNAPGYSDNHHFIGRLELAFLRGAAVEVGEIRPSVPPGPGEPTRSEFLSRPVLPPGSGWGAGWSDGLRQRSRRLASKFL